MLRDLLLLSLLWRDSKYSHSFRAFLDLHVLWIIVKGLKIVMYVGCSQWCRPKTVTWGAV